jgi:NADH-quinone oxidoreductase subunit F
MKILLDFDQQREPWTLRSYRERGGYEPLRKALTLDPMAIREEVKISGLRGRGGAGFPTGLKWSFFPKETPYPKYLCINADESEPGTFKDRYLMEMDPHKLIEGCIISSYALYVNTCFIYLRGEFDLQEKRLLQAISEAEAEGYLGKNIMGSGFSLNIIVHKGAGAYICGEETALMESLEGKKGLPRTKPPFPAQVGLFGYPTTINNVETIACIPWIVRNGGSAYARIGTEKSKGTKLFSASGHIERPGVYEVELGYPLKEFLENECGGVWNGKKLKAVIPGGSSVPVLTAEEALSVNLDYESLQNAGSMLGSGGFIVMDEDTDMVEVLRVITHFYADESCGQCSPCREGTGWAYRIVKRITEGKASREDLDILLDLAEGMIGRTICPLADAAALPILSFVRKFRDEFDAYIRYGRRKAA